LETGVTLEVIIITSEAENGSTLSDLHIVTYISRTRLRNGYTMVMGALIN